MAGTAKLGCLSWMVDAVEVHALRTCCSAAMDRNRLFEKETVVGIDMQS